MKIRMVRLSEEVYSILNNKCIDNGQTFDNEIRKLLKLKVTNKRLSR